MSDEMTYVRMWEGGYSLTYCELKASVFKSAPFVTGSEYRHYVYLFQNRLLKAYAPENEIEELAAIRKAQLFDPNNCRTMMLLCRDICFQMWDYVEKLNQQIWGSLPNEHLWNEYSRLIDYQRRNHAAFMISEPEVLHGFESEVEKYAKEVAKSDLEVVDIIATLCQPIAENELSRQEDEWSNLILVLAEIPQMRELAKQPYQAFFESLKTNYSKQFELITNHVVKYEWLSTQEFNDPWLLSGVARTLQNELTKPVNQLVELQACHKVNKLKSYERLHSVISSYLPPANVLYAATALREYGAIRWELRLARTKVDFAARPLRQEISCRLGISSYELEFLKYPEIREALSGNISAPIYKQLIKDRLKGFVFIINNGYEKILTGDECKSFCVKHLIEDTSRRLTIKGRTASPGFVRGRVAMISTAHSDLSSRVDQMTAGDILVTGMTRPQLIEACRKAAAIITDEGGIASHAAVVARELKIPCIVGTQFATKLLVNGDEIEVDAREIEGTIRIFPQSQQYNKGRRHYPSYIPLGHITNTESHLVGGKAMNLARLINGGFCVPPGIVIAATNHEDIFEKTNQRDFFSLIQSLNAPFAVRSSATVEDSELDSFAGMFLTRLGVSIEELPTAIHDVIRSAEHPRVHHYCQERGVNPSNIRTGVIVQEMVDCELSGVAFSVDPITQTSHNVHISMCLGLGELLMSGDITPCEYIIDINNYSIISSQVGFQQTSVQLVENQLVRESLNKSLLENVLEKYKDTPLIISKLAKQIEFLFSSPVEIEWGIRGSKIYVFQARSITTLNNERII